MSWRESSFTPCCEVGFVHHVLRTFLISRKPTWTRGTRVALLAVGLLATPACSFKDYDYQPSVAATGGAPGATSTADAGATGGASGTTSLEDAQASGGSSDSLCPGDSGAICEPACAAIAEIDDERLPLRKARWTFDGDSWLSSESALDQPLVLSSESADGGTRSKSPRLNGYGSALYLDGHQFAQHDGLKLSPMLDGFTFSAWISLKNSWIQEMKVQRDASNSRSVTLPILSTWDVRNESGGYQLDIRWENGEQVPSLVLSYQYPTGSETVCDAGPDCSDLPLLKYRLNKSSWAWGTGVWHHIAATYTPLIGQAANVALYWDGIVVGSNSYKGPMVQSTSGFYIGTNAIGANDVHAAKLEGYVDDVSVFVSPLEPQDVALFSVSSVTYEGPSQCRWRAAEARNERVAQEPSQCTWQQHDRNVASVSIFDGDWGNGGVYARVAAPGSVRDLSSFKEIRLSASIPDAKTRTGSFEFSLYAGDDRCTWFLKTTDSGEYTINLQEPDYCQTSPYTSCQFPIDRVEWAGITSSWEYPTEWQFHNNTFDYVVTALELVKDGSSPDGSRLGGVFGPNNWCWRVQSYQSAVGATAKWDFDANAEPETVRAKLSGGVNTICAIAADFGDNTLDLSECRRVEIETSSNSEANISLQLTLQDNMGVWVQWRLTADGLKYKFSFSDNPAATAKDNQELGDYPAYKDWMPWEFFPDFDLENVALFEVQKSWGLPIDADVTINQVSLFGENDAGCVKSGKQ